MGIQVSIASFIACRESVSHCTLSLAVFFSLPLPLSICLLKEKKKVVCVSSDTCLIAFSLIQTAWSGGVLQLSRAR